MTADGGTCRIAPWPGITQAPLANPRLPSAWAWLYGVVAAAAGWGEFTADWIAPFGAIFLRLLLLIAVPLVLASLITGIASLSDLSRKLSRIGGKTTAVIYVGTTLVAFLIGLTVVNLLEPGGTVPDGLRTPSSARRTKTDLDARENGRGGRPRPAGRCSRWSTWSQRTSLAPRPTTATCSTWCSWRFWWASRCC